MRTFIAVFFFYELEIRTSNNTAPSINTYHTFNFWEKLLLGKPNKTFRTLPNM